MEGRASVRESLNDLRKRIETTGEEEHKRWEHNLNLGQPLDWKDCSTRFCSVLREFLEDKDEGK